MDDEQVTSGEAEVDRDLDQLRALPPDARPDQVLPVLVHLHEQLNRRLSAARE